MGSEMCIRDSLGRGGQPGRLRRPDAGFVEFSAAVGEDDYRDDAEEALGEIGGVMEVEDALGVLLSQLHEEDLLSVACVSMVR